MKGKKLKFSCKKVEQKVFTEQLSQCLDEETPIVEGMMDIYEESDKIVKPYDNFEDQDLTDVSASLDHQSSPGIDGNSMVQCVPELTPPTKSTTKPKRPKFKVTPKRNDSERFGVKNTDERENPKKNSKNKEGSWVQCSKSDCLKWRRLPEGVEPISIPERWVCPMNEGFYTRPCCVDPSRMECAASQETCDSQTDYDVVYTQFVAGSIVWAKVPGYPWWPGMVEDDPDYRCCYEIDDTEVNPVSYHVSFIFDKEVSRSWVSCMNVKTFEGTPDPNETYSKFKKSSRQLMKAKELAQNALRMSLQARLEKFSFSALYKGVRKTEEIDSSPNDKNYQPDSDSSIHFEKEAYAVDSKKKEGKKAKRSKKVARSKKTSSSSSTKSHHTDDGGIMKTKKIRKKVLESSEEEGDVNNATLEKPKETVVIQQTTIFAETLQMVTTNDGGQSGVAEDDLKKGSQERVRENTCSKIIEENVEENICQDVSQNMSESVVVQREMATATKKATKAKKRKSSDLSYDGNNENVHKENVGRNVSKKVKKDSSLELEHGGGGKSSDEIIPQKPKAKKKRSNEAGVNISTQQVGDHDNMVPKVAQNPEVPKAKKKRSNEGGIGKNQQHISDSDMVSKISKKLKVMKNKKKSKLIKTGVTAEAKSESSGETGVLQEQMGSPRQEEKGIKSERKSNSPKNKKDCGSKKSSSKKRPSTETITTGDKGSPREDVAKKIARKSSSSGSNKKLKPTFKAPVKKGENQTKADKTSSSTNKVEKQPEDELKCYVSIDTLERDINNLYQEFSARDHTPAGEIHHEADCITVEFLDDELTVDLTVPCKPAGRRNLTDSPEY